MNDSRTDPTRLDYKELFIASDHDHIDIVNRLLSDPRVNTSDVEKIFHKYYGHHSIEKFNTYIINFKHKTL